MSFDSDLLRRYERNGPRYTSYPTAAQFNESFDAAAYRRAAILSNATPNRPLSLYLHLPFCAQPCFYCGCNRIIARSPRQAADYIPRLLREFDLQARLYDRRRVARQLHLGGGTPTYFDMPQLRQILDRLRERFQLDESGQREFSIEIDPRTLRDGLFTGLAQLGFNRLSFGIQDFDPDVQAAVNRMQTVAEVQRCFDLAREAGFRSISVDLIYGLPEQTLAGFEKTLRHTVEMQPDRVATYGYAHMPGRFRAQRAIDARRLPSSEVRLALLELTVRTLTDAGYVHIGMDHFARPTDDLALALAEGTLRRNFQGYSTGGCTDLVGLGVSAISALNGAFTQNERSLANYYRSLDEGRLPTERGLRLTIDDTARAEIIQRLMCGRGVCFEEIGAEFALDFRDYFAGELQRLQEMESDGLVSIERDCIAVTDRGRFLLRNIAMVFDRYLSAASPLAYSRAI
jgi:oxygen-independent coproporphyrinogen-3 oxidase